MKRKSLIVLVVIAVLTGAGAFMGNRILKSKGHPGLAVFLGQWWRNYPASFAVEPEVLELEVDQADLDALEDVVLTARERGVIMREGNDYVPGKMTSNGEAFKVKVRIKGKMADHVEGDKWSFRVVARKDKGFKGMQRFSLQHPGTRNYLCDWFYHRLMRGEGIAALRYGFLRLKFNGQDLGIYAYEEHFGPELLANNGRAKGPIFRFDPGLFWEHRLNMLEKVRYNEPFAAYQAAAVDAFGTNDLAKDSVQRLYFEEAVGRMDAFRRGQLKASEVFDADKIARRHAILDLVGGHHSMDWSDVKFYYDPLLKRVEPVAYESFSAFPIRTLAGSNRYTGSIRQSQDLHDAYFNDPEVFAAYVHHLERVSEPAFLDSAFKVLAPALDSASALIYREFPYKELNREVYRTNQRLIRKMLDVPKGFHAYAPPASDTLRITIIPIEGLPIEVHGAVGIGGAILPPTERTIVPCRSPGSMGKAMDIRIPLDETWQKAPATTITLQYSVLGASRRKTLEVFPYAYRDGLAIPAFAPPPGYDVHREAMLLVDDSSRTIRIKPGAHVITQSVFIPAGYTVFASSPLQVDLKAGARIISRSPMQWVGMDEAAITVRSSDASGAGLVLLTTGGSSLFRHVRIEDLGPAAVGSPAVLVQEADVTWENCDLGGGLTRDLLNVVRSTCKVKACTFTGGMDQLALLYAESALEQLDMRGAADDAVAVKGGVASWTDSEASGAKGSGLVLDEFAAMALTDVRLSTVKDVIGISEAARLVMKGGALVSTTGAAIDVEPKHDRHGASDVTLEGVELKAPMEPKIGKGNTVKVNGAAMQQTASAK